MARPRDSVWLRRRHFFEVNDQSWFPQTLREKVQDYLTLGWTNKLPIIQSISPAALTARILSSVLGPRVSDYVYVDFASGAGGPTPYLEKSMNSELREADKEEVKFVLSDISPHIGAWEAAAKKSENISFIPQSVDATNAPAQETLLRDVPGASGKKVMRLFSLAFHHFDDDLAAKVLENTIQTSDGFCIFELQSRHLSSFLLVSLLWPLAMISTPFYFPRKPGHWFFTYIVPIVPFIWVWDGYISCLRTRTPDEVEALLRRHVSEDKLEDWSFKSGHECHTWPIGYVNWIVCCKRSESQSTRRASCRP